jgi:hypothetical protein
MNSDFRESLFRPPIPTGVIEAPPGNSLSFVSTGMAGWRALWNDATWALICSNWALRSGKELLVCLQTLTGFLQPARARLRRDGMLLSRQVV